jgi:hypothetical protein
MATIWAPRVGKFPPARRAAARDCSGLAGCADPAGSRIGSRGQTHGADGRKVPQKGRPWPPLIECKRVLHRADLPDDPGAGDHDERTIAGTDNM